MSGTQINNQAPPVGVQQLVRPLSDKLRALFPKLCKPRKRHLCRLCGGWIKIAEECCRWTCLVSGEGYATSHAHPECYQVTLDNRWAEGDWECCTPGDVEKPNAE